MTGILRSLIWKEFHELKWKAAALMAIAVGAPFVIMSQRHLNVDDVLVALRFLFLPLGAAFVAMSVGASESSRGTLALLRSLPLKPSKVMAVKLVMGAAASLAPILAIYVLDACFLDRHLRGDPASRWIPACGTTLSVYLWTLAVAIGRRSEWQAGVAGAVVCLGWIVYMNVADSFENLSMRFTAAYASPWGFQVVMPGGAPTLVALQAPILSGLVAWSLWRFGRVPAKSLRAQSSPSTDRGDCSRLLVPRRDTPLRALVWLQWRQLRPLFLLAVISIPAWAVLLVYRTHSPGSLEEIGYAPHVLGAFTLYFGVFVSVLAATGAFSAELEPRLAVFWRSRPVGHVRWFWIKYSCGVAALIVVLSVPMLVGSLFLAYAPSASRDEFGLNLLVSLPLHLLVFTVTVCLMCLTRQPVASGILASAVGFGVILVPKYYDLKILAWDLSVYVPRLGTLHLGTLLGLTVPPLLIAWFVVKRRLR